MIQIYSKRVIPRFWFVPLTLIVCPLAGAKVSIPFLYQSCNDKRLIHVICNCLFLFLEIDKFCVSWRFELISIPLTDTIPMNKVWRVSKFSKKIDIKWEFLKGLGYEMFSWTTAHPMAGNNCLDHIFHEPDRHPLRKHDMITIRPLSLP